MKVTLVAPPFMDVAGGGLLPAGMDAVRECPPYGIYLLAGALRDEGHDVVVQDLVAQGSAVLPEVGDSDLVGIGSTSMSWATAADVVRQVRLVRPDVPIVLGGIHPTMFDRYLFGRFPIDFIVRGEAEVALPALCRALESDGDVGSVPNLTRRARDGRIVRNAVSPRIPPHALASFPLPAYDLLSAGVYKSLALESSRGCAFDCSFCSTGYRRTWRGIPPVPFVDRLEAVMTHLDRTRLRTVHIVDDEFSMSPDRATGIAHEIERRGMRPRLVFDSRATDLLAAGFVDAIEPFTYQFLVGAECGYDEGLAKIGKGTTCAILERAALILSRKGLSARADFSFIIGLPWEGRTEVDRTIRFAVHLSETYGVQILLNWYCQVPGSRLWEQDRLREVVHESMYDDHGWSSNLYLFRSGVRLAPKEIWDVVDQLSQIQGSAARGVPRRRIEFAIPPPIAKFFPRDDHASIDTGLASLREIAKPPVRIGMPLRNL